MTKAVESDTSGIVGTLHVYSNNENKTEGHTQTHLSLFCLCENLRDDYDLDLFRMRSREFRK